MSVSTVLFGSPSTRRAASFGLAAVVPVAVLVGASAPSPFYPVLQDQLGFSTSTLTGIFAVYAGALLVALLVAGSLSDHVGRRPVLSGGLVALAGSMLLFGAARSTGALLVARVVQGVATGVLTATMAAAVADLAPLDRPVRGTLVNSAGPFVGLAIGALVGGFLLDRVPGVRGELFATVAAVHLLLAALVWALPETSPRHSEVWRSLRPRVGVPAGARSVFWRSVPALVATWATGGLYLSLGAPLAGSVLHVTSHVGQAAVVALLMAAGAVAAFVAVGARHPRNVALTGTTLLAVGSALTVGAVVDASAALVAIGTVVAGAGFGSAFNGVLRALSPTVPMEQRGELFAAVYIVSYLAFGLPTIVAGLVVAHAGLPTTVVLYGATVAALAATAALLRVRD